MRPYMRQRLQIERLEDRLAPATLYFQGADPDWRSTLNWLDIDASTPTSPIYAVPTANDELVFTNSAQLSIVSLEIGDANPLSFQRVSIESGFTVQFTSAVSVAELEFNGGTITGAGSLTITSTLTWFDGVMRGDGSTIVATTATAEIHQQPSTTFLADTRIFVNRGETTWSGQFNVAPTTLIENRGEFTLSDLTYTFNPTTPIDNFDTLYLEAAIDLTGPLQISNTVVMNGQINVTGDVSIQTLTMTGGTMRGSGSLTILGLFKWEEGSLSGTGSTIVGPTGTLALSGIDQPHYLHGRTLSVQGTRVTHFGANGIASTSPTGPNPADFVYNGYFDNKGIASASTSGAPNFNAPAAAGALYRAMFGGVAGIGTEEEDIFRTLETIRLQDDLNRLISVYAQMNPGKPSLLESLRAELSGDDLQRMESLWALQWNRYVAVTLHQAIFAWSFTTDIDKMIRVLQEPRTSRTAVETTYASEYRVGATDAYLRGDLETMLPENQATRVVAVLDGNTAEATASAIFGLIHGDNGLQWRTAEALFELLRNRTPAEVEAIRQQYALISGANNFDNEIIAYLDSSFDYFGNVQNHIDYGNALLQGDRLLGIVRELHIAMDGIGTDEDKIWSRLTGLYADERAMVGQLYFQQYGETLLGRLQSEFSNNPIDGDELDKTLRIYQSGGLSLAERIHFAVSGFGTDEASLNIGLAQLRNMTAAEINALREQYFARFGISFDDAILGDLSGREDFEATITLRGRAENFATEILRMNERREYERGGFTNLGINLALDGMTYGLYTSSLNPMQQHAERYEESVAAANALMEQAAANGGLTPEQETQLRDLLQIAEQNLQTFRESRAATADLAANALATVAGIAVVIGSGGVATPVVVAWAAAAGAATQALTRMGIEGVFNIEELPRDLDLGAINAGTAALSFPALTPQQLASGVRIGILRQVAGSAFAGGAVSGGMASIMDENTWSEDFAVGTLRVTQAALTGGLASTALPGMIGAGVYLARAAAPLVLRIVNSTGTQVVHLFDGPWVRSAVQAITTGGQTIGQFFESNLTNWSSKAEEIVQRLLAASPNETEEATRLALREILATTNWGQIQRNIIEEQGVNVLRIHRGEMQAMGASGVRSRFLAISETSMRAMKEASDSLRTRLTAAGAVFTVEQADNLAKGFAALQNMDDASIRALLQVELGVGVNITDDMVRTVREFRNRRLAPTGTVGQSPTGTRTGINPNDAPENILALTRENESADILAAAGYQVEQNPTAAAGSTRYPDYRIEGEYWDCLAPTTSRVRNIWSRLEEKILNEQASNIVLNLTDSPVTIEQLRQQFT